MHFFAKTGFIGESYIGKIRAILFNPFSKDDLNFLALEFSNRIDCILQLCFQSEVKFIVIQSF